jgi:hypothetical protein
MKKLNIIGVMVFIGVGAIHNLFAAYVPGSINYEPLVGGIPGWYLQYPPNESGIRAKNYRSKHCGPSAGCERGCKVCDPAPNPVRACEVDEPQDGHEYW